MNNNFINSDDIKYHNYKLEDFQKSEMIVHNLNDVKFKTEIVTVNKDGLFLVLGTKTTNTNKQ